MTLIGRRRWYFNEQKGICHLRITQQCKARGGAMEYNKPKGCSHTPKAFATWDHTFPRQHRKPGEGRLVMLACYKCNNKRGSAPPTADVIARATELRERWAQFYAEQQAKIEARRHRKAQRKAQRRLVREMQRAVSAA